MSRKWASAALMKVIDDGKSIFGSRGQLNRTVELPVAGSRKVLDDHIILAGHKCPARPAAAIVAHLIEISPDRKSQTLDNRSTRPLGGIEINIS